MPISREPRLSRIGRGRGCPERALRSVQEAYALLVEQAIREWFAEHGLTQDAAPKVSPRARKLVDDAMRTIQASADRDLRKVERVLGAKAAGGQALLDAFRTRNVRLIKTAGEKTIARLDAALKEHGNLHRDALTKKLLEVADVSRSRARFWAVDQTLKLNAAVTRAKHESLGIVKYVWRTSRDGSVRDEHAALEGKTFRYDDPPETGTGKHNPGEDYWCRCHADPVLEDIEVPKPKRQPRQPRVAKPRKPKVVREHTRAHWQQHYEQDGFGSASNSLSYGRATYERSGALSAKKLDALFATLEKERAIPHQWRADLLSMQRWTQPKYRTKVVTGRAPTTVAEIARVLAEDGRIGFAAALRARAAIAEHLTQTKGVVIRADVRDRKNDPRALDATRAMLQKFGRFSAVEVPVGQVLVYDLHRDYYTGGRGGDVHTKGKPKVVAHELGHALETSSDARLRRAEAFLERRGRGLEIKPLNELVPGNYPDVTERAYDDRFWDPYVGKIYSSATEITSMGVQHLLDEDGGGRLLREDPEHFWFTLGQFQ